MGIGTADVESITSYIKRLAQAHNVSTGIMLEKEILPELNKPYLNMYYLNSGSLRLCGYSDVTKGLVDILEDKTLNRDLNHLTLIPLEDYINTFKLNKRNHSWCPICYEEMKQNGQAIFDKLIWNIEGIEVCEKHNVKLEQICPYCGKNNQLITRRSRVGYCDSCHSWLGLSSVSALIDDGWHNQIYDAVGKLLCNKEAATKSQFNNNIQKISSLFRSQKGFYSTFKITPITFGRWLRGSKPSLFNVITLSLQLGISLNEMLTTEIDLANVTMSNLIKNIDFRHSKYIKEQFNIPSNDYATIKHSLNLIIHSYDGTSLSRFCKENYTTPTTLKEHFPTETKKLSELYQRHKEDISRQRRL
jgi:hypothetical protein